MVYQIRYLIFVIASLIFSAISLAQPEKQQSFENIIRDRQIVGAELLRDYYQALYGPGFTANPKNPRGAI